MEPTVPPSRLSKANSWSKYLLVLWNPAATVNAVNKFIVVACFLTKIARESFILWSCMNWGQRKIYVASLADMADVKREKSDHSIL